MRNLGLQHFPTKDFGVGKIFRVFEIAIIIESDEYLGVEFSLDGVLSWLCIIFTNVTQLLHRSRYTDILYTGLKSRKYSGEAIRFNVQTLKSNLKVLHFTV